MESTPHGYAIITPEDVQSQQTESRGAHTLLLDVRTPAEFAAYHIPGATLLPVDELPRRFHELDPEQTTICICEHGVRSEAAAAFLAGQDFASVATMRGGMARWTGEVERGGI